MLQTVRIPPAKQNGDPNGIRTRVTAVKGRCPRPLDDRVGERQISRRRQTLQAAFVALPPATSCIDRLVPAVGRPNSHELDEVFSMNAAVRAAASRCG
jgi:hypothetical protein